MVFNTHSHINDATLEDAHEMIVRSINDQVSKIACVGYNIPSSFKAITLAEKEENVYAICGIQPEEIESFDGNYTPLIECLNHPRCIALGEIGLDYYYGKENKEKQLLIFEEQLKIATTIHKPIAIHTREAMQDTYDLLAKYASRLDGIILHCYTGSVEMMHRFLALGAYISISGVVTFKNAKEVKEVVKKCPLDRLLVETDDPYLAPTPHRGEKNEPSFVTYVVDEIAKLKECSYDEIAASTYQNACKVFHL